MTGSEHGVRAGERGSEVCGPTTGTHGAQGARGLSQRGRRSCSRQPSGHCRCGTRGKPLWFAVGAEVCIRCETPDF